MKERIVADYTKKKKIKKIFRSIGHWKEDENEKNIFERHFASLHDPIRKY